MEGKGGDSPEMGGGGSSSNGVLWVLFPLVSMLPVPFLFLDISHQM